MLIAFADSTGAVGKSVFKVHRRGTVEWLARAAFPDPPK